MKLADVDFAVKRVGVFFDEQFVATVHSPRVPRIKSESAATVYEQITYFNPHPAHHAGLRRR
jgi:hypothetical protein